MNIDRTNVSVVVSPQAFKKIVEQQIEAFDSHFQTWLHDHFIALKEFDDVLVSAGVANCNLVYEYLQKLFPNTVFRSMNWMNPQYFPDLLSIYNPKNNMNESVAVSGAAIQVENTQKSLNCSVRVGWE